HTMQDKVGKRQTDQITTLYKDMNDTVTVYAKSNGIHLILAYGEQLEGNPFNFTNVNRQFQGMDLGAAHPIYVERGLDISAAVASILNQQYRAAPATPASQSK